jgi:HEAT repeat protein
MPGAPDAGGRAEVLQPRPLPTPVPGRGGTGPGDAPDDDDLELLIRTAMEHPDPLERAAAISDLALEDDLEVVAPVLQHASADEHQDVKLAVVMALSQFGEAVPLDLLNQYANDPDPEVRLEVLDLVADLSEEDGIPGVAKPILDRAMRDPDEEVRSRAAEIQDYLNEVAGESDSDLE